MSTISTDVEIWLTGDAASVSRAISALAADARITQLSEEHPLVGADAGRVRRYVRLAKHTSGPQRPARPAAEQLPITKETSR
ncbi:hypothetical protein [Catellatospora paridis]|uniref:hypothetical protein n=1 Tax=Catellatospora paridis TaxID=1617086 RepID=UPI0012D39E95|nr:hypothetical protein [Catellatospora paridis]